MDINNIYNNEIISDYQNINDIDSDSYTDTKNLVELTEKLRKLKIKLNEEEQKVKQSEKIIQLLSDLQKQKEDKYFEFLKEFNERESELKLEYKINEEDILETKNQKENLYKQTINNIEQNIKNIENENKKINQQINLYKNNNIQIENKFNISDENLKNNLIQKDYEIEELQKQLDFLNNQIINKENIYEQRINTLNLKLIQLNQLNNNKLKRISNNQNNNMNINNNNELYKSANNFYSKKDNNFLMEENIEEDFKNNIIYLRDKIQNLKIKSFKLTRILSLKYEENEELNKEKNNLKKKIQNIKNKKEKNNIIDKNNSSSILKGINEENKLNKIVELKMMINNYKNEFSRIKMEIDNMTIQHKLNINNIIISYENKISKLVEKINNLKILKNDYNQISDEITGNLFDDN